MERVEDGIRIILVISSSMCLVLSCSGHEGREPSLPKMRAG